MDATSDAASVSASTAATTASTLSSCTTNLYWGSKGWTFLLSIHESSWEISPLCFNSLVQILLVVYFSGHLLARLSSGMLEILLVFKIGYVLGFTLIFSSYDQLRVQKIYIFSGRSWTYWKLLRFSWLVMLKFWPGQSDGGFVLFPRRLDSLIVDNAEITVKLYCIMC